MEFELTSEQLNAILTGEAHFVATHLNEKKAFYNQTQEASIQEKTYRVLVNDGEKTNIHYISKDLPVSEILRYFNIKTYKNIDEQNLLTTTLKPELTEWWVRQINNRDIIIAKDNLRSLSDHYMEGFQKFNLKLVRVNGVLVAPLKITKNPAAKVLLKIRGEQNTVTFSLNTIKRGQRIGGQNADFWECKDQYRNASAVTTHALKEDFMLDILDLHSKNKTLNTIKAADDEKGRFLEIKVETPAEEFDLAIDGLPNNLYVQEGIYHSKCIGANEPKIKPNLQVPERSLTMNVEAFVEKI